MSDPETSHSAARVDRGLCAQIAVLSRLQYSDHFPLQVRPPSLRRRRSDDPDLRFPIDGYRLQMEVVIHLIVELAKRQKLV